MDHESQHEYHDKNPMLHAYKKAEADILAELKKGIALIEGSEHTTDSAHIKKLHAIANEITVIAAAVETPADASV
jgi:hypothetical protein